MGVQPIAVPGRLAAILNSAGDKSGVDFDYLLNTAMRESSLDPTAKAPSSSATGLFQFLDGTWLRLMKQEGPRLGYQQYANAIQQTADGDYSVADKALRQKILDLREDPQVSADLAAAYTRENGEYLQQQFGRMPSPGELYIAHFLGAQGAGTLFSAGLSNPDQSAAALFPQQAKANPTIFYHNGRARTVKELYQTLVAGQSAGSPVIQADASPDAGDARFSAQQITSDRWPTQEVPSRFTPADMSFTSLFSNETEIPGRVLMSPASEAQGPALFTGFYGQGTPRPLVAADGAGPASGAAGVSAVDGGPATESAPAEPIEPLPMPPPGG